MAILAMLKIVPGWCWWILALTALCLGFELHGRHAVQLRWDSYAMAQALAGKQALDQRNEENAQLKKIQQATSINIQKVHDNEILVLHNAFANSERLRIGAAFCGTAARQTEADGAGRSHGADTGNRLLSPEMDAAVKQLILESEAAAAAGRAAQAFIRANGMAPD